MGSLAHALRIAPGVMALVRSARWAYVGFVALGLLYFPAKAGFRFDPQPCRLALDLPLALHRCATSRT